MYNQFNGVGSHPLIPSEAFLYSPQSNNKNVQFVQDYEQLVSDDYLIPTTKTTIRRLLYENNVPFTGVQNQKLQEFEQYLARKNIQIDPRWNKSWRLRFLQSTNYDFKKCIPEMATFIEHQNANQQLKYTNVVQKCLTSGIYYVAGRDCKFRPIIVLDVKKLINSKMTEQEVRECETYFFEYILRNLLIPGQVQNWITVIDVGNQGVLSMASPMKSSISFLQSTYRARMFVCYIVRPSSTCSFMWSIAQNFLTVDTKRKIKFVEGDQMTDLLQYCLPSQLEQKFGGKARNLGDKEFWPPRSFGDEYANSDTHFYSKQQYFDMFQKGMLKETKAYEPYTKKAVKRSNSNLKKLKEKDEQMQKVINALKEFDPLVLQQLHKQGESLCGQSRFKQLFTNC